MADHAGQQLILPVGVIVRDSAGGRYVIEGLIGEGQSGAVYLVSDPRERQHRFALKEVIDPNQRARERLTFEGEVLQRLLHRALPRVYRVFEQDKPKRVYLLMDYIAGQDLATLQQKQPSQRFALPVALALMAPIVDALVYLHQQDPPVVHRDIKPANIIVSPGADEAVLVDFGSAKEYTPGTKTVAVGHLASGYTAPEQYSSGTTPQTDIYGLGATFYTLLTGTIPPDSITRVTAPRGRDPLQPAYLIVPEVPWAVSEALERALSISHEDRFETVEAFWRALSVPATQQPMQVSGSTLGDILRPLSEQDTERLARSHSPRLPSFFTEAGSRLANFFSGRGNKKQRETQLSLFAIARTTLEADDRAIVDKVYTVQAGISQHRPVDFRSEPFRVSVQNPVEPLLFGILLHPSENIELMGAQYQPLRYDPRNAEPQFISCPFRLRGPGRGYIVINFYRERQWLKTIRFEFDGIEQAMLSTALHGR